MIDVKNIHGKKNILGQFFTNPQLCKKLVSTLDLSGKFVVEPSFGTGNFVNELANLGIQIQGVELDTELFDVVHKKYFKNPKVSLSNCNFYDFWIDSPNEIVFVGNPPFRTPAYSLTTHGKFIRKLRKKFGVSGIREEAVFFILHSIDIILSSKKGCGEIHYVLPKSILKNNSRFFTNFKQFMKRTCVITNVVSIGLSEFDGVSQELMFISMKVPSINEQCNQQSKVVVDGIFVDIDDFLCLNDDGIIPFQSIFKKTYCGSVPCESILMSISGEPIEHFRERLCKIIESDSLDKHKLYDLLSYKSRFHLKVFSRRSFQDDMVQSKLDKLLSYVANMKEKENIIEEFRNIDNYKEINGRNEILYYFRCNKLKKSSNFVYDLNPNPCKSFYFPGNPTSNSGDYFGYCNYDVNRNLGPGANRTVPIEGLEDNLTEQFKEWWTAHTDEPFSNIFDYMIYVSTSDWYKNRKQTHKRFYFGIPKEFIPKAERLKSYPQVM